MTENILTTLSAYLLIFEIMEYLSYHVNNIFSHYLMVSVFTLVYLVRRTYSLSKFYAANSLFTQKLSFMLQPTFGDKQSNLNLFL